MTKREEIIQRYKTAKDKTAAVAEISKELNIPEKDVRDILREAKLRPGNGRRKREADPEIFSRNNTDNSENAQKVTGNSAGSSEGTTDIFEEATGSSGETTDIFATRTGSSGVPEAVRLALKDHAQMYSQKLKEHREKMDECYKGLAEIFEYVERIGMSETDLMR